MLGVRFQKSRFPPPGLGEPTLRTLELGKLALVLIHDSPRRAKPLELGPQRFRVVGKLFEISTALHFRLPLHRQSVLELRAPR